MILSKLAGAGNTLVRTVLATIELPLWQWQLVEYAHAHCPEWRDPGESMIPIEMRDLFLAFGLDDETARAAAALQEERNAINAAFSSKA